MNIDDGVYVNGLWLSRGITRELQAYERQSLQSAFAPIGETPFEKIENGAAMIAANSSDTHPPTVNLAHLTFAGYRILAGGCLNAKLNDLFKKHDVSVDQLGQTIGVQEGYNRAQVPKEYNLTSKARTVLTAARCRSHNMSKWDALYNSLISAFPNKEIGLANSIKDGSITTF